MFGFGDVFDVFLEVFVGQDVLVIWRDRKPLLFIAGFVELG